MIRRTAVALTGLLIVLTAAGDEPPADDQAETIRARAWSELTSRLHEERYRKHSLAVEAVMRKMACEVGAGEDNWGLAGLLHDIDLAETSGDASQHGPVGAKTISVLGFPDSVVHAVAAHDDHAGIARESPMDKALYCADQMYWAVQAASEDSGPGLRQADADQVWREIQAMPSRRDTVDKLSAECRAAGLAPQRVVAVTIGVLQEQSE